MGTRTYADTLSEGQTTRIRSAAVEAQDVAVIAACDAALNWDAFDPHGYLISARELPFRTRAEARQLVADLCW